MPITLLWETGLRVCLYITDLPMAKDRWHKFEADAKIPAMDVQLMYHKSTQGLARFIGASP